MNEKKTQLEKIEAMIMAEIDEYNVIHPESIGMNDVLRYLKRTSIVLRSNQEEPVRIGIEYFRNSIAETEIDYVVQKDDSFQHISQVTGTSVIKLKKLTHNFIEPGLNLRIKIYRPAIIVAPTAFGKSILIAKIAENIDDKILILQPNKELLEQNFTKFIELGGKHASIFSASFNQKQVQDVTYATLGSIYKNGITFKAMGFTKIIMDECHLYPRNMESMIGKFLKDSEITHVLGLTATPLQLQQFTEPNGKRSACLQMLSNRSVKGQFFKDILYVSQIQEMVKQGYWTKLEYEQYDMDFSGLKYNSTKDDYTEASLNYVYRTNDTHAKIIQKLSEIQERKSVIVFVYRVAEAQALARAVPNSAAIYGDMPASERDAAITDFKNGKLRVVFNVNVLSHGFDSPNVDCIITARPTASITFYYQQLGRGVRILTDKKDCLIVDFSGNVRKFGKIEDLTYRKEGDIWELYNTQERISGIPLYKIGYPTVEKIMPIGEYTGTPIKDLSKEYKKQILETFTWTKDTLWIREEIIAEDFTSI